MKYKFTTDNFDAEVLQADMPVLVDFYSDRCMPCRMMAPIVEKIAEEYDGRMKVGKCNTDENMQLAMNYRISSIPTFMFFKAGKPTAVYVGAMQESELKEKAEQALLK